MKLSKRLQAVFQMIKPGSIVADIGCDHGFLPIALIQEKVCKLAYACDLREGPLHKAMDMITKYKMQDKVIPLLRNGIQNLPEDVDTIVIAGMGFETIKMILEQNFCDLHKYNQFIIQSNTDVDKLRFWLYENGFLILDEDIVYEGHYYQIISFSLSQGNMISEEDCLFGIKLYEHPLFKSMWEHNLKKVSNILKQIPKSSLNYKDMKQYKERIEAILYKT